jgi:ABC-type bacteriocin/lantibiotic exporter with double-glycine peptidase domain
MVHLDHFQSLHKVTEDFMSDSRLLSDLYHTALPSVPDQSSRKMPGSLYGYVCKMSGRQQVRLCLLTVLAFPLTLVPLELQRRIVDEAVADTNIHLLFLFGGLYFATVLSQGALKFVRNVYMTRVAEGVTRTLRRRIAQSESFGTSSDEGTKQSIILSEAENIGGFVAESIALPLLQVGIVISVAGYMLVVDPLIATVAIFFLFPSVIVVALSQSVLNRLSEKKITVTRELGECVLSVGRDEEGEDPDPDSFIERIYRLRLRFAIIKHAMKGLNNLISHMGPLSVLMVGGWLAIQGQAEIGTIVAFMSGYQRMTDPARDLLNFYRRLAMMRVQYDLVYDAA